MDELIKKYTLHIQKLEKRISDALDDQLDAGPETVRSYDLIIRNAQKSLLEAEAVLNNLTEIQQRKLAPGYDPAEELIHIFVISGSLERVKSALGQEFFAMLTETLHSISAGDWKPFSSQDSNIKDFLEEVKKHGFNFTVTFLEGKVEGSILQKVIDPNRNNIAIVDLMSLDDINIRTAIYFDGKNNNTVFAPVSTFLDNNLKKFLFDKRKNVFTIVESNYMCMPSFMFDVSDKRNLEREILNHLKRHKLIPTFLQDRPADLPAGFIP